MLNESPLVRSAGARTFFLLSAVITLAIRLWMNALPSEQLAALTPIFRSLFLYGEYSDYGATAVAVLVLVLAALFSSSSLPWRAVCWTGEHPLRVALGSAVVLCVGALVVYRNHPLSMDEYAAYFQSRIFAAGQLNGQFPPGLVDWLIPGGFQDYFLNVSTATGDVASAYWPGFALLLTPFTWLGVPWLCNPLITSATLVVVHRLAMELFDNVEAAGFALMLAAASPVLFGNGISYYSMPAHLLANALFALLLLRPSPRRVLAAGLVGSVALSLHNPVPHLLFAAPWVIWIVVRPDGWRLLARLCLGYLPLCLVLGLGWFLFSDHLIHEGTAMAAHANPVGRLRSHLSVFTWPAFPILLARLIGVAKVWIWAVPGIVILAVAGAGRGSRCVPLRLFALSALLTLVGYLFVPVDQGHGWGFRYFHSAWVALPLLATAAMFRPRGATLPPLPFEDGATRRFVAASVLLCLAIGVGYRAVQMQAFMVEHLAQLPHYSGTERQVVVVDTQHSFYGADLVQNDPWLRGDVVRLYGHGAAEDAAVIARHFPGFHRVYGDRYGIVWSASPSAAPDPNAPGRRGP